MHSPLHAPALPAYLAVDGVPVKTNPRRPPRQPLIPVRSRRARRKQERLAWGLGALVLIATAAAAVLRQVSFSLDKTPAARELTAYVGEEIHPSFSADGGLIAFAWRPAAERIFHIYSRSVGSGRPILLTHGNSDEGSPVFSPDGTELAFLRYSDPAHATVLVMLAAGGPERELRNIAVDPLEQALDWSPDGRWLVAIDRKHLALISPVTGEEQHLTYPADGEEDLEPAFAPDGGSVLFVRSGRGGGRIARQSLAPLGEPLENPKLIDFPGFIASNFSCPRWLPDGQGILFIARRGGLDAIWQARLTGGSAARPEPIYSARPGNLLTDLSVARQGWKLIFSRNSTGREIRRLALPLGEPRRSELMFLATGEQETPRYSPDGKQIVFASSRNGSYELWLGGSDGASPAPLDDIRSLEAGSPQWSPDGRMLVFESRGTNIPQVWSMAAAAAGKARCLTPNADGRTPSWSSDGKTVYFSSRRSGKWEIWQTTPGSGPARQITHGGGWAPLASADGKFLYYQLKPGDTSLWRTAPASGQPLQIAASIVDQAFAITANGLYYLTDQGHGAIELRHWDSRSARSESIGRVPGVGVRDLSISPDGRWMLFSRLSQPSADLMILDRLTGRE